eukprot:PhM_4_TR662/c0_g1_i1/m.39571
MASTLINEIKTNLPMGLIGIDQMDWGGKGGAFYEIWKVSPCCGTPSFNLVDALMCALQWHFCSCCSVWKLYGSSLGQQCAWIPQCPFVWFCPLCTVVATRYNVRKKSGVKGNIIGDLVCTLFCGCCSFCQVLRAVNNGSWRLWPFVPPTVQQPIKFLMI